MANTVDREARNDYRNLAKEVAEYQKKNETDLAAIRESQLELKDELSHTAVDLRKDLSEQMADLNRVVMNLATKVGEIATSVKQIQQQERPAASTQPEIPAENNTRYQEDYFAYDMNPNLARYGRIECPNFDGSDSFRGWLYKCEQFLEINRIPAQNRIRIVFFHLFGDALEWHQCYMEDKREVNVSWEQYRNAMSLRFDRNILKRPLIQLKKMQQVGSVEEYQQEFERIRFQAQCSETQALDMFLGGLKEKLQCFVAALQPTSVMEAFHYATLYETALSSDISPAPAITTYKQYPATIRNQNPVLPTPNYQKRLPQTAQANSHNNQNPKNNNQLVLNTKPRKHMLSDAEYKEKRAKNQCFWCDSKFTPGHNCEKKRLYSLEICAVEEPEEFVEALDAEFPPPEDDEHNICMYALNGLPVHNTPKIEGSLGERRVLTLLDSGSSHNVIRQELVEELQCLTEPVAAYKVTLADGKKVEGSRMCKNLKWVAGNTEFVMDALVLPLWDYDLILGMQWLESLGCVTWDFKARKLQFNHEGKEVVLQAVPKPTIEWMTSEQLLNTIEKDVEQTGNQYFLVHTGPRVCSNSVETREQEQEKALDTVLSQFEDVFAEPKSLPPKRVADHRIPLKVTEPISVKPYRYPAIQKDAMEQMVKEMLEAGVIRDSTSAFSSPVVLVKKKDGSWRMCVDYRELNKATVKDKFPMPVIEELLDELHGARFFSKIDLRAGYHQIRMYEPDIHKTAFRTHAGHYEFLVMPFGLTNAPSTFQSEMNRMLSKELRKFALVFFDDILIYSRSWEEHLEHIQRILEILRQNQFFAKRSKCQFGTQQIEYLGHIITQQGVATDPAKVEAMQAWPVPKSVKALKGFLGLTGYYRRFIKNYGIIAKPLTKLLQKDGFEWSEQAQRAFQDLKAAMVRAPVLSMPDFKEKFVIETDASGGGIGAVLMQQHHPIAYLSKALAPKHLGLSTYEKELLALVMAVTKWRSYLLGRQFIIKTDHHSLKYLVEQRMVTPIQQKWLSKLLGFDYEIQYKKGVDNVAADSLSRIHSSAISLYAYSTVAPDLFNEIQESWVYDSDLQELIAKISAGTAAECYSFQDKQLRKKGRLLVGRNDTLRRKIISFLHDSAVGGHSGVAVTTQKVQSMFAWKGLKRNVREFIRCCDICQKNKSENVASPGLLQPLPIPNRIWEEISMDFIDGLPASQGYTIIWVVVDRLSKYGHFIAVKHPYTASSVARLFMIHIFRLHGLPKAIVSDRDPAFTSLFWKELFRECKVSLNFTSAYHPQSDGQTERVNRCVEAYLRCMTGTKPKEWTEWLPLAEYWYNTNFHSSTQSTPYEIVYGQPPPTYIPYIPGDSRNAAVDRALTARESMLRSIKEHLNKAQNRMKQMADSRRSERSFEVGDWVYLKLQPFKQFTLTQQLTHKLSPKYCGPFEILKKVGSVAYELALPETAKVHKVFHVCLLKKCWPGSVDQSRVMTGFPADLVQEGVASFYPIKVLDRKLSKFRNQARVMWLVQWFEQEPEGATWENAEDIRKRFPEFDPDSCGQES